MTALLVLAIFITLGCAAACTRRLYFACNPIVFHASPWLAFVRRGEGDRVRRAIAREPRADWERELLEALADPNETARAGRINEQLSELDYRLTRWARVPRVCASIASSAGFLCASLAVRFGLAATSAVADEVRSDAINAVVLQAVNVAALGVAGAAFAIAAQYRARKAAQTFQRDADALIEALEKTAKTREE
ncbi:MAG TPA: hypothetical protein VH054_21215 [Polyangiaceae bacterium]|nr:hypothetical protein [Polyangiaceae bacterium]